MRSREARSADLNAILAIQAQHPGLPAWTRLQFDSEMGIPGRAVLVVEDEGGVAGYACLTFVPPEAQLHMIAVAKEKGRRGVGKSLLDHVRAVAAAEKCGKIALEVSAANAVARAFYEREGFVVVGRRAKFYNDGQDAILMDLSL
jgi:[ribosomal protein S18]-alanine N-acetyltransferase